MNATAVLNKKDKKEALQPGSASLALVPAVSTYTPHRQLFSDSFLEPSGLDRRRRRGTALVSVIIQSTIVLVLILLPLWFTDVLPTQQLTTFLVAPPPPPPPPPPAAPVKAMERVSQIINGQLLTPSKIPKKVQMIKEEEAPPPAMGVAGGVVGGVPGGQTGGVIGSLIAATNHGPAPVASEIPKRLKVSQGVSLGLLENRVEPVYPIIARRSRVQGTVQLRAVIATNGSIANLQLVEGHPFLVSAAIDAVRQWHYRPYMLSGVPVEVETTIFVNFHLDR
ncbi:MAG: energy transducer TonB [Acidobacteriia bacterium]|nr:energy transducer TonB [Terriglobia bacterium]